MNAKLESQELDKVKFKKHKLPFKFREALFKLEMLVGLARCLPENLGSLELEIDALALADFTTAKKYKLYQGNYWCKVTRLIPDLQNREKEEAIAALNKLGLATYALSNKECLLCFTSEELEEFAARLN
ncbi:MAG: hypothetical protein QNJ72_27155 [Pleurocapsa sp. MO_226.B13]|nr:hypothetical protein [Pleurocapsa sp. MO_226.B13]